MMTTIYNKLPVLTIGQPTVTSKIYSLEIIEKAISDFKSRSFPLLGELYPLHYLSANDLCSTICLENVSHEILDLYLENNILYADIKLLNTPAGKMITTLNRDFLYLGIRGTGRYSDNEVIDFNFITIDIYSSKEPQNVFKN